MLPKKIRPLYGFTFRVNESGIFQVLNDNKIDALSLTRNILIHTDGVIDKEFDDRRGEIAAFNCFASTKRDEKIELTGQIVRELLTPMVELGFGLVRSVDAWLTNNP